jgi:hypothetical protein
MPTADRFLFPLRDFQTLPTITTEMNTYYRYFWFSFTGGVRQAGGSA